MPRNSGDVFTKQRRIAELAKQSPAMAFTSLAYLLDVDWLREAYRRIRKSGAPGVDGQTSSDYERNLEENLQSLVDRAKSGTYRAPCCLSRHSKGFCPNFRHSEYRIPFGAERTGWDSHASSISDANHSHGSVGGRVERQSHTPPLHLSAGMLRQLLIAMVPSQTRQLFDRFVAIRNSLASRRASSSCWGILSPIPKYISSGV